jgi:hypothetical protein
MGYEYDKIQGNYPVVWLPDLPKSNKKVIKKKKEYWRLVLHSD